MKRGRDSYRFINFYYNCLIGFDDHQLAKRNKLIQVGDTLVAWDDNPRMGFSHVFNVVKITNRVNLLLTAKPGCVIETIKEMRGKTPILYHNTKETDYGLEECYLPQFVYLPRNVTLDIQ